MFSALSENHGDLNKKLNAFIALAPIVNLNNATMGLFVSLGYEWKFAQEFLNFISVWEVLGPGIGGFN